MDGRRAINEKAAPWAAFACGSGEPAQPLRAIASGRLAPAKRSAQ